MVSLPDIGELNRAEHIGPAMTGDNIDAKKVALYGLNGTQWQALSATGGSLVSVAYDYISAAYPVNTTEVYSYYRGGSGGALVATVTVVYTDSTKANVSTVART